jgi:hypothetical protein
MHYVGEIRTLSFVRGDTSTLKTYDSYFVYPPKELAVFTVPEAFKRWLPFFRVVGQTTVLV